jgi:hypothetical protein
LGFAETGAGALVGQSLFLASPSTLYRRNDGAASPASFRAVAPFLLAKTATAITPIADESAKS